MAKPEVPLHKKVAGGFGRIVEERNVYTLAIRNGIFGRFSHLPRGHLKVEIFTEHPSDLREVPL